MQHTTDLTMKQKLSTDNGLQRLADRTPAGNKGFASGGLKCKIQDM